MKLITLKQIDGTRLDIDPSTITSLDRCKAIKNPICPERTVVMNKDNLWLVVEDITTIRDLAREAEDHG